jgi:hypothetical protein
VTGALQAVTGAASFSAAQTSAASTIGAGTVNIVTAAVGTTTYVFADTNNDNAIDTVIALTGTTAPAVAAADFAA